MATGTFSRRKFAQAVGAALGAAVVAPDLTKSMGAAAAARAASIPARLPEGSEGDWVELNSNENPYGPSARAMEAITKSEREASRYPDALEGRVIDAIAKLHHVERNNVLLGCGSGEILRVADLAFLAPNNKAVAAEPTFESVLDFARAMQANPIKVPLTPDHRHDLKAMAAAGQGAGLIYVCNPNNPTGTVVTRDEMEDFFTRAPKGVPILWDEAYHHFVESPKYATAFEYLGKVPNLILTRTFSKVYGMAGMRLGYAVAQPNLIQAMRRYKLFSSANAAVMEAAAVSLEDPAHVADQKTKINGARDWMCKELDRDGRAYIRSEANFVMIDVGGDVHPVIRKFEEKRILVGRKFPSMANWLRVSVGTPKEMETFVAALREIVPSAKSAKAV